MRRNQKVCHPLRRTATAVAMAGALLLMGGSCRTFDGKPTPPPVLPRAPADPTQVANTLIAVLTVNSPVSNPSRRWRLALAADSALTHPRLQALLAALEPRLRREPQLFWYGPAAPGLKLDFQLRLRVEGPTAGVPAPTLLAELLTADGRTVVWTYRTEL